MNIKQAKEQIKNAMVAYFAKDRLGSYEIPIAKQRPVFLMGPPGIGKTAIMEQIAQELDVALVNYSMTHHTRQSALGLPFIVKKTYGGKEYDISEYTMSEIIASVYDMMETTGKREGILFLDEINCVSETLAPAMLQFLQFKIFGRHQVPEGWIVVTAGKQEWKFAKNNALGGYKIMGYLGESPYVQIPEQIGDLKVVSISPNAFAGNGVLESIVIPDTVVQIGAGAFCDCKKLQSVTLPKDLTLLDKKVFQGTAMQEITLPAGIQKIASSALGNHLQRIELAGESKTFTAVDGVLYNKKVTVFACVPQGRISITIPETIKGLKELDFAYVPSLTDVYIPASVAVLGDQWIFYEDGYDVTIHAPAGSQWEEYAKNHKTKFQAI